MRTLGITVVVLLVARVYLDPGSQGIESLTEALFWAGLGISIVCLATRGRSRSYLWKALVFYLICRKKVKRNEISKRSRKQGPRPHRG